MTCCIFVVPARANDPRWNHSTSTAITVQWEAVTEGSLQKFYDIEWKSSNNRTNGSGSTQETLFTATNLASNTAYDFTVRARNQLGCGRFSRDERFYTS